VAAHAPWLEGQLRLVRPALVVTLGRAALHYFIRGARLTDVHGTPHRIQREDLAFTLYPLFHPAAVIRGSRLLTRYQRDFARIPTLLSRALDA
jgi:uracil-DNA glycosylase family 4